MKLRVKVAVVLNARETGHMARFLMRTATSGGKAIERPSPRDQEEEQKVIREFLEKNHAAQGVASTDERDG